MFQAGQLVVCVSRIVPSRYGEKLPVVGRVYRVREMVACDGTIGVRLEEVVNLELLYRLLVSGSVVMECAFRSEYFRPVTDQGDVGLEGAVTPHSLRHTAATWLMQAGTDLWEAAGYLGMTIEMLSTRYGHHHPNHLSGARDAFRRHRLMGKVAA